MNKYLVLTVFTFVCCMFFSCSSDDEAEKELDLTGTWYLSSYEEYEDGEVISVEISKSDSKSKKVLKKRDGQVYDVVCMERQIKPDELGDCNFENPVYGDWVKVANETYIFKDNKLLTDYIDYDVISMNSKKIKLGLYVCVSIDEPNFKKYLMETYSKMD